MRVGLIVDSACDLPYEFSRKHDLFILPVTAKIDNQVFIDNHDPVLTQEFYQSGLLQKGHQAETEAFSAGQIHDLLMEKVVTQFDVAICETVTRSRSLIFQNATDAYNTVMGSCQQAREAAGVPGKFSMRVIDSKQIFAGQGLLAAHTLRLIDQKLSKNVLRQAVEAFTDRMYTCVIPRDLHYIRERARRRGDKSISAVVAFLGKVMNYAAGRVEAGLLTPYVSLSCGLSWTEIEELPGLNRLRDACERNGVELLLSQMGITSSIYIGPGSVCLSLAAEPHQFSDFQ